MRRRRRNLNPPAAGSRVQLACTDHGALGRCCLEPSVGDFALAETEWLSQRAEARSLMRMQHVANQALLQDDPIPRYISTYLDVSVCIHVDLAVSELPMSLVDYCLYLIKTTNDAFQLRTPEFTQWSSRSVQEMEDDFQLPNSVAAAITRFLSPEVAMVPRLRLVLESIQIRPKDTDYVVDASKTIDLQELKLRRLPFVAGAFNIWVSTLTDGLLGIATFPFEEKVEEFGVIVDYRSTHPSLVTHESAKQYAHNRTMPHEVGHCFGLFHTFTDPTTPLSHGFGAMPDADTPLEQDRVGDGAAETPPQRHPTEGNPLVNWPDDSAVFNSQGEVVAFCNFMDYTADPAMLALCRDQVGRMEYFFQNNVRSRLVKRVVDTQETDYDSLPPPPAASSIRVITLEGAYTPLPGVTGKPEVSSGSSLLPWQLALIIIASLLLAGGIAAGIYVARRKKVARLAGNVR